MLQAGCMWRASAARAGCSCSVVRRAASSAAPKAPRRAPAPTSQAQRRGRRRPYWKTLEHRGPLFPPPYSPLPKRVALLYNGKPVPLAPKAEEIAGFYAKLLHSEHVHKDTFRKNFWADWRKAMTAAERRVIKSLADCDFSKIQAHYRDRPKQQPAKGDALHATATVDGQPQPIGNFRIEPPGLFQGRGEHPKMGKVKARVQPSDVVINVGPVSRAPKPPKPHRRWAEVRSDSTVAWLASWTENINNSRKYIFLAATAPLKGDSDQAKFDMARRLTKGLAPIQRKYRKDLTSRHAAERQRAAAIYLIETLAIRAGSRGKAQGADTVGCCTLRCEHIELMPKGFEVRLDFFGKDVMRFDRTFAVPEKVWNVLAECCRGKAPSSLLFDKLTPAHVNQYLQGLMPGLTTKVFRTYRASSLLQAELDQTPQDSSTLSKLSFYNEASRKVAVFCNHKKAVPKNFGERTAVLQAALKAKRAELRAARADQRALKNEPQTKPAAVLRAKQKVERLRGRLEVQEERLKAREALSSVALGTSKLNYLDPRISVAWSRRAQVPIAKVYNATQQQRFAWALADTEDDFRF